MEARSESEHIRLARHWQHEVFFCEFCTHVIIDGTERIWTGQHDAPLGQFRYRCTVCDNVNLCEGCFDKFNTGDGTVHTKTHAFEHVPPIKSRREAAALSGRTASRETPTNPWGAFRGGVSGQAFDRLYRRTGFR